jgi:tetratricopeptide (TPR) repeat protein
MESDGEPLTRMVPTLIGRTLGRYRIDRRLGAGGMGEVYRAYDEQLDRHVAIKVLPASTLGDPVARARLIREARTASQLNHPNICTIHEASEADGHAYIAMELVEGESLRVRLKPGPLKPHEILRYALQLTEALMHAHERGVIHRDLKSANIIITPDNRVKVLDFGLAKQARNEPIEVTTERRDTLTRPGTLVGTPAYMAPEQLRGQPADVRTDVWGLGVVLYEMTAGRLPFAGRTEFETTAAILDTPPRPLPDHVPKAISAIIERCLQKNPTHRYQDAGAVQSAVQSAAARVTPVGGLRRRLSRKWVLTTAVGATAALAAVALNVGHVRRWTDELFSQRVTAFAERDWLMVADFDNRTTDKVFDKALDIALTVGLGQSSYVNVLPPSRIEGALRRMKIPAANRIDAATARQIALREGVKLVLVPSITEIGGVYELSGLLQDPASGSMKASAIVRARRKSDVLGGIDELVQNIRNDLGEARRSISRQSKPLDRVTTTSLDALKTFSLAREAHRAARIDEARALYEDALRIDPAFTAARASLGMLNFELRDRDKGKQLLAEAIKDIDGLTVRERYSALAFHAAAVDNNPQKAIDYYTALLAEYPDAAAAHNNIGRAYMQMGRWEQAIGALKSALQIEPNVMLTYNSLNQIYLFQLGNLDAAIALCRQQLAHNDQSQWAHSNLGWALLGKGDLQQARAAFQKALAINPRSTDDLFRLGITYRLEGRDREALDTFLQIPAIDPQERAAYYDAGVAARAMGDERAARRHFSTFRRLVERQIRDDPKTGGYYLELAEVLSRLGDHARATVAAGRGMALDPTQHFEYANFLSVEGRRDEAFRHLQLAVDGGYRNVVWMKVGPDLEPLAGDPRLDALLARNVSR